MSFLEKIRNDFNLLAEPKEGTLLFDTSEFQRWGPNRQRYRWRGNTFQRNGKQHKVGTFIDMVTGAKKTYQTWKDSDLKPKDFLELVKKKEKLIEKSIKSFEEIFKTLNPAPVEHPYLMKKQISLYGDIRMDDKQNLCIPSLSLDEEKNIIGISTINTDGGKLSYKGSTKGWYSIGKITPIIYICEGYSTACTIHELTKCHVIMTFGLIGHKKRHPVIDYFAEKYDKYQIVICIDNIKSKELEKHKIENGEMYAQKISKLYKGYLNTIVIRPLVTLEDSENITSDFNDLFKKNPVDAQKQLTNLPEACYIIPLGHCGKTSYFYSSYNQEIHSVDKSDKMSSLVLMAPEEYWNKKFSFANEKKMVESLQGICSKKAYELKNFRKAGLYSNGDKLCLNDGFMVTGEKEPGKLYLPIGRYPKLKKYPSNEVYWQELKSLVFGEMNVESIYSVIQVFCWMTLGNMVRAIPFRFNMDFCGESSAGKTWFFKNVIIPYMEDFNVLRPVTTQDTMATIKDSFKDGRMIPIIMEGEADQSKDRKWLYDLSRESSDGEVYSTKFERGGGISHIPVSLMILSLFNARGYRSKADENRLIEVPFVISDKKNFLSIANMFQPMHLKKLSLNFTFNIINSWDTFLKKYNSYLKHYSEKINNHKARIYSQILSAIEINQMLSHDETKTYIKWTEDNSDNWTELQLAEKGERESDLLITALFSMRVSSPDGKGTRSLSWIINHLSYLEDDDNKFFPEYIKVLENEFGVRFGIGRGEMEKQVYIYLWKNCSQFSVHLQRLGLSRYKDGFYYILSNEIGKKAIIKIGGISRQCVKIPLKKYIDNTIYFGIHEAVRSTYNSREHLKRGV